MSSIYYSRNGNAGLAGYNFMRKTIVEDLLETDAIDTGEWQSMDTTGSKLHMTRELTDVTITCDLPPHTKEYDASVFSLGAYFKPDLPWANDHFEERVSGKPLNPPPSHVDWPYAVRGNGDHTANGQFDHTYPERYWPKQAGQGNLFTTNRGIRYAYGDLGDVVALLQESPMTRQAYLPVWFPEDTGGHAKVVGARVPCSLGYHFMIRDGALSTRYYIRSMDVYRHMTNDLYLTARLALWVVEQINNSGAPVVKLGTMTTHVASLHSFVGDDARLRSMVG